MILKIDIRESSLIQLCQQNINTNNQYKKIQLVTEALPIGDVIICDNVKEYLIIERKTLLDLSASIKDGRYDEQSYRLDGLNHPNHNIIYLIEGEMNGILMKSNKGKVDTSMLYSAMFSINYNKGFSVMRSSNITETATILCNMCSKLEKDMTKGRLPYYKIVNPTQQHPQRQQTKQTKETKETNESEGETKISEESGESGELEELEELEETENNNLCEVDGPKNYCTVIKKNKKENITKENIGEIMLCQIPGISSTIAIAIMKNYVSFRELMNDINTNPSCLNNLCTTDKNGKQRKISKSVISTIIEFLTN
jgi:ERCC4-type nuclease